MLKNALFSLGHIVWSTFVSMVTSAVKHRQVVQHRTRTFLPKTAPLLPRDTSFACIYLEHDFNTTLFLTSPARPPHLHSSLSRRAECGLPTTATAARQYRIRVRLSGRHESEYTGAQPPSLPTQCPVSAKSPEKHAMPRFPSRNGCWRRSSSMHWPLTSPP